MGISRCLFVFFINYLLFSCSDTDEKLHAYINKELNASSDDSCYINLIDALEIKYDTMYIFGEFCKAGEISSVLRQDYVNADAVEEGSRRIILLKEGKVVYEDTYEQKYIIISGGERLKNIDPTKITCYCRVYASPVFLVERINDDKGHLTKYFYLLQNVKKDGTISPVEQMVDGVWQ